MVVEEEAKDVVDIVSHRTTLTRPTSNVIIVTKTEEEILLMAYIDNKESHPNTWYLDSSCSNHMSGNKSLFSYLDETW
ncbi:unnamed protein product [Prunus armeniaca]